MAKKVIFNNKKDGKVFIILVGKVGEHVFAITRNVKDVNDAIRWCTYHKAGDVYETELYKLEII